jgi:hypothetical protein
MKGSGIAMRKEGKKERMYGCTERRKERRKGREPLKMRGQCDNLSSCLL